MNSHHQQESDTTLNMNMPIIIAALASRVPFSFNKKRFAFALEPPPRTGLVFLSSAGLESAR